MMRSALIITALLAAPAASACAIQPQSCTIPGGGVAYLDGFNGAVVVFSEYANEAERFVVTECNSRSSLGIVPPSGDDWSAYWAAQATISDAVFDEADQGLRDLADQIRQTGVETQVFTLPDNHCGCDLPRMPVPRSNCPADY